MINNAPPFVALPFIQAACGRADTGIDAENS